MSAIALPGEPLVDEATALRPWRDSDVAALVPACRDPAVVRWTQVPENYGENDARAFLLYRYEAIHAGTIAPFAIVGASDDGRLLGSISLSRITAEHARAEVGYFLARGARGQGHATRALRLICSWGLASLGLERIDLIAATDNAASQRVAERAGFTREALLRSYLRGKHSRYDAVAFGRQQPELR